MSDWVIGIDLGGTKIAIGLITPQNEIVARCRIPTHADRPPQQAVNRIAQKVAELKQKIPSGERLTALGICSPGPLDPITGTLIDPPNLPAFHNTPLCQMLEDSLKLPVVLEHDAKAAALGEFHYGGGREVSSMVYIVVGTGVGAAIIREGEIIRGVRNTAGEVGHITLDRNGEWCSCGSRGCVETYMSGPWLGHRYRVALPEENPPVFTGAQVAQFAAQGDPLATRILREAGEALGIAVASMAMILDIERFIIGGSVYKSGDLLLEPARQIVPQYSYKSVGPRVTIKGAELGDDGPILGCGWLARQMSEKSRQPITMPPPQAVAMPINTAKEVDQTQTGIVFDIQRYSVHDGPGLRTNVFLKGCPLRCGWCANPESQRLNPELAIFKTRCIRCGQFDTTCADYRTAQPDTGDFTERVDLCPVGAVDYFGRVRTVASVLDEVRRDKPFYNGGGGLTLTGGEPTMQPRFAEALLKTAKSEDISTAIETSGYAPWSTFERLLPHLDSVLFDFKHVDSKIHQEYTGVGNELILDNLRKLAFCGIRLTVRIPLIPGFNTSEKTLETMGRFIAEDLNARIARLDLLPYHTLGKNKYDALARPYPWEHHRRLSADDVETFAGIFLKMGLPVTVGG